MDRLEDDEDSDDQLLKAVAWTPSVVPFTGTDRYRLHACLGEGGFGVVYEVEDRETGRRLALKTLKPHRSGFAANIKRLKREFRAVADLVHPNLVGLHELSSHESRWFFTMDLVRGANFRDHVAGSEARLRAALAQLVAGVSALHRAGIIHRDLKPSNVLVERDGRVVILDFGLADVEQPDDPDLYDAGTPTFMAPEQAAGEVVTAAADWYSVGVMLYEALAGSAPATGSLDHAPADLSRLCTELLRQDPRARPSSDQIHAMLGRRAPVVDVREPYFIGRKRELAILQDAYARRAALVQIEGQPGVGKSALIAQFCDRLPGDAIVLAGRCHEREAVPFKAFDGVVDALAAYLQSLPRHEAAALMPRDIALVKKLFPVLDGVAAIHDVPTRPAPIDPREVRELSFAALKELFARISDKGPLVIVIDDLQWSDGDSERLLVHLLAPPRASVLIVLAYRSEDRSPTLRETLRVLAATGARAIEIAVAPLPPGEAEELAVAMLGAASTTAKLIAERGEGHPLFIAELARAHDRATDSPPSLLDMLWQRVQRLSASARALVETLAVAGEPLPTGLCCAAAGLGDEAVEAVRVLRAEHLIRAGERGDINVFHDRIRDAVIERADAGTRRKRHLSLARSLERTSNADLETLARHFDAAHEFEHAARYVLRAADAAMKSLAFDRAAQLCQMAIERKPTAELYEKLGESLLHGGLDAAAGKAFLEAADLSPGDHATRLRGLAGQHMLDVGDVDAGYGAIERALADVGENLPASMGQSLREAVRHIVILRLRGTRFREQDASQVARATLLRLDVLNAACMGLASADFSRGIGLYMRTARLALQVGEPHRVAMAFILMSMIADNNRSDVLLDEAETIATRLSDWNAVAFAMRMRAQNKHIYGDLPRAQLMCDATSALITERCTGMGECYRFVRMLSALIDTKLGNFERADRRGQVELLAAEERGDPVAARLVGVTSLVPVGLAADDVDRAQQFYDRTATEDRCAALLLGAEAAASIAMYRGRAHDAVAAIHSRTREIKAAGLLTPPGFRLIYVRALATALCASGGSPSEARRLMRSIRGYKFAQGRATYDSLAALVALHSGKTAKATALLLEAARQFEQASCVPDAASCRYRAGELAGDPALVAAAEATLRGCGIVNPARWVAMVIPARGSLRSSPIPEAVS